MLFEREPSQMDDDGKLGPIRDICVIAAQRTFIKRQKVDTNPTIVQMIHQHRLVPHWYYRSEQFIDQPYFIPGQFLQPYRGPAFLANPGLYGPGTYIIDKELTKLTKRVGFID